MDVGTIAVGRDGFIADLVFLDEERRLENVALAFSHRRHHVMHVQSQSNDAPVRLGCVVRREDVVAAIGHVHMQIATFDCIVLGQRRERQERANVLVVVGHALRLALGIGQEAVGVATKVTARAILQAHLTHMSTLAKTNENALFVTSNIPTRHARLGTPWIGGGPS